MGGCGKKKTVHPSTLGIHVCVVYTNTVCFKLYVPKFRHNTVHRALTNRLGMHTKCEGIMCTGRQLYYQIMSLFSIHSVPIPVFCSYVYTLLGGVRSEADGARFSYTNKEQIFEGSCKDIDTVRNMDIVARSDLLVP